jgi:hypothetical protein
MKGQAVEPIPLWVIVRASDELDSSNRLGSPVRWHCRVEFTLKVGGTYGAIAGFNCGRDRLNRRPKQVQKLFNGRFPVGDARFRDSILNVGVLTTIVPADCTVDLAPVVGRAPVPSTVIKRLPVGIDAALRGLSGEAD